MTTWIHNVRVMGDEALVHRLYEGRDPTDRVLGCGVPVTPAMHLAIFNQALVTCVPCLASVFSMEATALRLTRRIETMKDRNLDPETIEEVRRRLGEVLSRGA